MTREEAISRAYEESLSVFWIANLGAALRDAALEELRVRAACRRMGHNDDGRVSVTLEVNAMDVDSTWRDMLNAIRDYK